MPMLHTFLTYYGLVSLATMLFFWTFTVAGFLTPDIKKDANEKGMSFSSALLMGLIMGVTWPKSMFNLMKFMRSYKGDV